MPYKYTNHICECCYQSYPRCGPSRSGLCPICAAHKVEEVKQQLKARTGIYYERWLRSMRRALGAKPHRRKEGRRLLRVPSSK